PEFLLSLLAMDSEHSARSARLPMEHSDMKKSTGLQIKSLVLVVLLVTLAVFVYRRERATLKVDVQDTAQGAVRLQERVDREGYAVVGFIILMGLLAFITWTALRAGKGKDEAVPSTGESNSQSRR